MSYFALPLSRRPTLSSSLFSMVISPPTINHNASVSSSLSLLLWNSIKLNYKHRRIPYPVFRSDVDLRLWWFCFPSIHNSDASLTNSSRLAFNASTSIVCSWFEENSSPFWSFDRRSILHEIQRNSRENLMRDIIVSSVSLPSLLPLIWPC